MAEKIQLAIDKPCHENWDKMSPVDKGRFCNSCRKKVIDFTNMNDHEIAQFFKRPAVGSVCGRFMQDQLDRDMMIPKKRIPWIKYFFQFALPATMMSLKATAQGDVRVIKQEQHQSLADSIQQKPVTRQTINPNSVNDDSGIQSCISVRKGKVVAYYQGKGKPIHGRIVDENGNPVSLASIAACGTIYRQQTAEDGSFSLRLSRRWKKAELMIMASGFAIKKIEVNHNEIEATPVIIKLNADQH